MKTISILLCFTLFISLSSCESRKAIKEPTLTANVEKTIRHSLNIPDQAQQVLILSHAAHMDWDWLNAFPYNVNKSGPRYRDYFSPYSSSEPANEILTQATQNLQDPAYYYSVCEMGFLRAFANDQPALFNQMKASGRLRIVGGGITSPDNLLPNGETFFRNFLVANTWLDEVQVPWSSQVWIPDDFGHDPQLPVMLNAMDAMGVGFARIPGACDGGSQDFTTPVEQLLDTTNGGVDFIWKSSDGSEVIAHWLEDHYSQGADIDTPGASNYANPSNIMNCNNIKVTGNSSVEHISSYIGANQPVSPTPYIYVHVSNDFMMPYQKLVSDAKTWNTDPNGYAKTGVYAVVATFDEYIRLVDHYKPQLKTRTYNANTAVTSFSPNPYWMGYYASRPELKILHNKATKSLLRAESFQVLENFLLGTDAIDKQVQSDSIYSAWNILSASTHHDFVTGTAIDSVYLNEQLPLLNEALNKGDNISKKFMQNITNNIVATSGSVAVFNQLGMSNQGIIPYTPTGGKLTYLNVSAPSLGYELNAVATSSQGDGSLKASANPNGNYYLENNFLLATLNSTSGEIVSLIDKATGKNILSGYGNEIVFYEDGGDIYRFGYESSNCSFSEDKTVSYKVTSINFDIKNPLNKAIIIDKQYNVNGTLIPYTLIYSLRQGEPFLRISTTGTAPDPYTVMVKFPLQNQVNSIDVGTPYHWNTVTPMTYGNFAFNATMWATHDFVIPKDASGTALGAIYHKATPAWTSVDNTLYGVILRNTPGSGCMNYGADGSDNLKHTQEYAIRIPSGITNTSSGNPLKEARQYNTPMIALSAPTSGAGNLPTSYSLAVPSGNSLITAAKWSNVNSNDFILRLYQASNMSLSETISVAKTPVASNIVTALEKPFVNATNNGSCSMSNNKVNVMMPKAVATVKVSF